MRTVILLVAICLVSGRAESQEPRKMARTPTGPARGTTEWKIQNAMSAAPASLAKNATIMDWPTKEGEKPRLLRAGTNGYTCFPAPGPKANDPMCLDKVWLDWADAWMHKKPFSPTQTGIGYMLQGAAATSETDPFKKTPSPGENWSPDPPHLMVINPDTTALAALPAKRSAGGPWLMWKGTPYQHVMIPVK